MFETLGINMVVKGMSVFARDVSHVATSLGRFAGASARAEKAAYRNVMAQEKLAVTLVSRTAKAILTLQKRLASQTLTLDKYTLSVARAQRTAAQYTSVIAHHQSLVDDLAKKVKVLTEEQAAYDKKIYKGSASAKALAAAMETQVIIIEKAIAAINAHTPAFNRALNAQDALTVATWNQEAAYKKLVEIAEALFLENERLTAANVALTEAQENTAGFLADTGKEMGILGTFITSLTGGWGKYITTQSAVGKALSVAIPQIAALSLGLDVFKIGLDAVVWSVKFFIGAIKAIITVIGKLLKPIWDAAKFIGKHLWEAFKKIVALPFNIAVGGIKKFTDSIKRILEITLGMGLDRILWGIGQGLRGLAERAKDAAINFQLLSIRMRGLLIQEVMQQNMVDYAGAMDMASVKAQELTRWISKIAVTTIFGAEDIANVFALAMSYDFTSKKAQELTTSVLDFATGMGLGDQEMRRVIENFGQMRAQGKLAGTELRDLARGAFVPVNAVLLQMGKNLGIIADIALPSIAAIGEELDNLARSGKYSADAIEKFRKQLTAVTADGELTREEFKKLAQELPADLFKNLGISLEDLNKIIDELPVGKLKDKLDEMIAGGTASVDDFFLAFQDLVAERFPDAAQTMGQSMQAVISNIQDFIETMIGWRALAPTFEFVAEQISGVINSLMSDKSFDLFEDLGQVFLNITKVAYALADALAYLFNTGANKALINKATWALRGFIGALASLGQDDKKFIESLDMIRESLKLLGLSTSGWSQISTALWDAYDLFERILAGEVATGDLGFEELKERLYKIVTDIWTPLWGEVIKPGLIMLLGKIKTVIGDYWTNNIIPAFTKWKEDVFFPGLTKFLTETVPGWAKTVPGYIETIVYWVNSQLLVSLSELELWAIDHSGEQSGLALFFGLLKSLSKYMGLKMEGPTYERDDTPGKAQDYSDPFESSGLARSFNNLEVAIGKLLEKALTPLADWFEDHDTQLSNFVTSLELLAKTTTGINLAPAFLDLIAAIGDLGTTLNLWDENGNTETLNTFLLIILKLMATFRLFGQSAAIMTMDLMTIALKNLGAAVLFIKSVLAGETDWSVLQTLFTDNLPTSFGDALKGIWDDPEIGVGISDGIDGFLETFTTEWESADFVGVTEDTMAGIVSVFDGEEMKTAGGNVITKFLAGLKDKFTGVETWWDTTLASMVTDAKNQKPKMYNAGWDIIVGLYNGLKTRLDILMTWWSKAIAALYAKLAGLLGIGSPSKVFMAAGVNIGLGLQLGIEKGMQGAVMAMRIKAIDLQQSMGVVNSNNQQYNTSNTTTNNYSLGVQTNQPVAGVIQGYEVLRAMAR